MTTRLTTAQKEQTLAAVQRLCLADLDAATLLRRVARALYRVVPCDLYAAATIDPGSNLITQAFAGSPREDEQSRSVNPDWFDRFYFAETFDQTLALVRQRRWAVTIGDVTNGRLERSLCYREAMRPAGVADKIHAVFFDRGLWGDIELYRASGSPPFSADEVALVGRVAPDVAAGLRHAALRARADAEDAAETAPGVVIVDAHGRVTATPASERLLAGLGDLPPRWQERGELPIPVRVVLGALEKTAASAPSGEAAEPRLRVRARNGRWLTLHAARSDATEIRQAERIVVITPSRPHEIAWLGLAAYDLSPREEEVVRLVVGGQSTKQISDRLFIAEHTVQRHLSNIFEKVGVRGRRALVKHLFVEQVLPGMA
jgi:DNA-binding CsgD family transcriptional regulator